MEADDVATATVRNPLETVSTSAIVTRTSQHYLKTPSGADATLADLAQEPRRSATGALEQPQDNGADKRAMKINSTMARSSLSTAGCTSEALLALLRVNKTIAAEIEASAFSAWRTGERHHIAAAEARPDGTFDVRVELRQGETGLVTRSKTVRVDAGGGVVPEVPSGANITALKHEYTRDVGDGSVTVALVVETNKRSHEITLRLASDATFEMLYRGSTASFVPVSLDAAARSRLAAFLEGLKPQYTEARQAAWTKVQTALRVRTA